MRTGGRRKTSGVGVTRPTPAWCLALRAYAFRSPCGRLSTASISAILIIPLQCNIDQAWAHTRDVQMMCDVVFVGGVECCTLHGGNHVPLVARHAIESGAMQF
jgi:hypothetical protein